MKAKLQLKFIRIVTISVLIIFGVSAFAVVFFWGRDNRARQIADEQERMEMSAAQVLEMQTNVHNMALSLVMNREVQDFIRDSGKNVSRYLIQRYEARKILNSHSHIMDYVQEIMVYTKDGRMASSMWVREDFDPETNEWYTSFKSTGKQKGYTGVHLNAGTQIFQRWVISYVMSCHDYNHPDDILGDLLVEMDIDFLKEAIQLGTDYVDGYCLFDSEGNEIVSEGKWQIPFEELGQGSKGNVILTTKNMMDDWTLAVALSDRALWGPAGSVAMLLACIMAILLAVLIPVLIFVSRKILQPIQQLTECATEVGQGNFDVSVNIHTGDEMEVLADGFQEMIQNIQKLMNEAVENEKLTRRMQVDRLMLQINPHFIYNTLNSIVYMAKMSNNPEIAEFAVAFISLLQNTLRARNSIYISLEEELSNVKNYLKLQEYRYADKFQAEILCPEELLKAAIPNVMLQPIVENAIFHGIAPKTEKGHLWIRISEEGGDLQISVADDGVGMTEEMRSTMMDKEQVDTGGIHRIGVANVSRRIHEIYGDRYGMAIESEPGKGTRIVMRIPYTEYKE